MCYQNIKNFSECYPSSIFFELQSIRGPEEIVNFFVEFYQGVYVSESESVSLPTLDTFPVAHGVSCPRRQLLRKPFLELDEQKSPGPCGISPSILRKLVSVVKVLLWLMFNMSLLTGIFPAVWKESFIVPIFKRGEKWNISCYRELSILSVILKLFEEMICDEITPVIRPQISVMQHGFMMGRSTVESNLVEFSNFVIDKIENGHLVDGVYTDYLKAFDRVNYSLLCFHLMRSFSEMTLASFLSYLTGRTQRVRFDDFLSDVI
jgi:hypothetical protein